jgi:signal peptide peptidase SppA
MIDGIAIIPIQGILVHGCTWWGWNETDYGSIRELITAAFADPEVRAIVLLVNSPGGEVAGCFDLADWMFSVRGTKPMWAILNENAFSAAYALACCADRIIVPRTGGTGSIGVISMHVDITAALEKFGIKVSTIQFGDRKSDSYPTTPLSDVARDRLQADVDLMGEMFVDLVARNRKLAASKVRGTQAGCFLGALGVTAGLADEVLSPDEAFLKLVDTVA